MYKYELNNLKYLFHIAFLLTLTYLFVFEFLVVHSCRNFYLVLMLLLLLADNVKIKHQNK